MSWTLALDTATPTTVAGALGRSPDAAAGARETPAPGARPDHTRRLLPLARRALAEAGGALEAVDRIVVGLGPGTFTGIRVGVSSARALGLGLGTEVVGTPTPAALAAAALGDRPGGAPSPGAAPVLVVQDARRRELFLTLAGPGDLRDGGAGLLPAAVPIADLEAALAALPVRPGLAVGDGAATHRDALVAAGVPVPEDPSAHEVDGVVLAGLGRRVAARGPQAVRPVYVRGADAIPTAQR
ncbi:tRNA (adenosine(37)-N6)-threonylcarbamoyltransferase complex dimerization subunit type 1 TsaB [Patulibacter brassicae]|uniref:tRNA (Adenosine(37)-N6)-threonylcarbamoyltransferase complex dimerization subunit type 1 TsaB n=1 Tax=Patulibacter brassicae TaxID=1705717 RepID=A0ABU4VHC6_9ACTN|nr:tRNA (adenosine(37)-N6)-threonylcarbamoyltransferase complex dimerization subunit type 1 TsaB [Patulibacter brassicae]MDX8150544.1 tRNA (adenosine(37)-N6)-threonylcarbamoyltransferase complex dimerization subunit type 1 TsaB [Patulibacter brassicae]